MRTMRWLTVLWLATLGAVLVPTAHADSIGSFSLTGCGTVGSGCPDATYSFNVSSTSSTLSIQIDGAVTAGTNDYITGVDLGFAPSSSFSNLTLSSNPGGSWTTVETGSLSNAGCGGNKGAFVCASGTGVQIAQGNTYSWTWSYDTLSSYAGANDVHVGTNYGPHNGLIVSTTLPEAVPEPGTLSMLALGLGLIAIVGLRRKQILQVPA